MDQKRKEEEVEKLAVSWQQRFDELSHEKDQELQEVETYVRKTLEIKDEKISQLTTMLEEQTIKYRQMEMLLEKQRKELLLQ